MIREANLSHLLLPRLQSDHPSARLSSPVPYERRTERQVLGRRWMVTRNGGWRGCDRGSRGGIRRGTDQWLGDPTIQRRRLKQPVLACCINALAGKGSARRAAPLLSLPARFSGEDRPGE